MNVTEAATRYAALIALRDAISAEADVAARQLAGLGLAKGSVPTPLGPVTLAENKERNTIGVTNHFGLIAWCEQNLPSALLRPEPVVVVNEQSKTQLLTVRFVKVGTQVLDSDTGEVLDFVEAKHTPAGLPTIRYGASAEQTEVKKAAARVVAARTADLTATIVTAHEMAKMIEAAVDD